jgi:hypothetical protein
MPNEYNITIGSAGIRREVGEVVSVSKDGVVFLYKKPRSAQRVQITIAPQNLILLKVKGSKSEVVFISPAFDLVDYSGVSKVMLSDISGINIGETRQGEKLYFSPTLAHVSSLVKGKRKRRDKSTNKPNREKAPKGKPVKAPSW